MALPLVTVCLFAGLNILNRYQDLVSAQQSLKFVETSIKLVELIHQIQQERSISARYSESRGANGTEELLLQRALTDKQIELFSFKVEGYISCKGYLFGY